MHENELEETEETIVIEKRKLRALVEALEKIERLDSGLAKVGMSNGSMDICREAIAAFRGEK